MEPGLGNGVGNELRVAGGVEDCPLVLEPGPQPVHVHQIAVVDHRQRSLHILDGQGLGVLPRPSAGGGVAHMAHRHGPIQALKGLPVEDLADQSHVLIKGLLPVIDSRDAAGLLPPVLEGVQPVIGGLGAAALRVIDPEYTALLVEPLLQPDVFHTHDILRPFRLRRLACPGKKIVYYSAPRSDHQGQDLKYFYKIPALSRIFCRIFQIIWRKGEKFHGSRSAVFVFHS